MCDAATAWHYLAFDRLNVVLPSYQYIYVTTVSSLWEILATTPTELHSAKSTKNNFGVKSFERKTNMQDLGDVQNMNKDKKAIANSSALYLYQTLTPIVI